MVIIDTVRGIKAGTETQLYLLINNLDKRKYDINLICLRETEWMKENRSTLGCKVRLFNINSIINPTSILSFIQLVKYIKKGNPDIVMTFFRDSNIIGVIAARLAKTNVIISTRRDYGLWLDKRTYFFLALANRFVKGIIANSSKVKELTCCKEIVDCSKVKVIYNGIKFKNVGIVDSDNTILKEKLEIPKEIRLLG